MCIPIQVRGPNPKFNIHWHRRANNVRSAVNHGSRYRVSSVYQQSGCAQRCAGGKTYVCAGPALGFAVYTNASSGHKRVFRLVRPKCKTVGLLDHRGKVGQLLELEGRDGRRIGSQLIPPLFHDLKAACQQVVLHHHKRRHGRVRPHHHD